MICSSVNLVQSTFTREPRGTPSNRWFTYTDSSANGTSTRRKLSNLSAQGPIGVRSIPDLGATRHKLIAYHYTGAWLFPLSGDVEGIRHDLELRQTRSRAASQSDLQRNVPRDGQATRRFGSLVSSRRSIPSVHHSDTRLLSDRF